MPTESAAKQRNYLRTSGSHFLEWKEKLLCKVISLVQFVLKMILEEIPLHSAVIIILLIHGKIKRIIILMVITTGFIKITSYRQTVRFVTGLDEYPE